MTSRFVPLALLGLMLGGVTGMAGQSEGECQATSSSDNPAGAFRLPRLIRSAAETRTYVQ